MLRQLPAKGEAQSQEGVLIWVNPRQRLGCRQQKSRKQAQRSKEGEMGKKKANTGCLVSRGCGQWGPKCSGVSLSLKNHVEHASTLDCQRMGRLGIHPQTLPLSPPGELISPWGHAWGAQLPPVTLDTAPGQQRRDVPPAASLTWGAGNTAIRWATGMGQRSWPSRKRWSQQSLKDEWVSSKPVQRWVQEQRKGLRTSGRRNIMSKDKEIKNMRCF